MSMFHAKQQWRIPAYASIESEMCCYNSMPLPCYMCVQPKTDGVEIGPVAEQLGLFLPTSEAQKIKIYYLVTRLLIIVNCILFCWIFCFVKIQIKIQILISVYYLLNIKIAVSIKEMQWF